MSTDSLNCKSKRLFLLPGDGGESSFFASFFSLTLDLQMGHGALSHSSYESRIKGTLVETAHPLVWGCGRQGAGARDQRSAKLSRGLVHTVGLWLLFS